MDSENILVLLSVVFKKSGLIANEFLSDICQFLMSASSTLALNYISLTLAIITVR